MRRFEATLTRSDDETWTLTVPGADPIALADPGLADFEVGQLLRRHLELDPSEVDDLDIALVDDQGSRVFAFDLLFTALSTPSLPPALLTDPPAGCHVVDFGGIPGLRCVRHGPSRLVAIATLVAEIRDRHGVEADDLGFEKLWEWMGGRDWRERMIAHLLLMATHRAKLTGVPAEEVVAFVRAAMG